MGALRDKSERVRRENEKNNPEETRAKREKEEEEKRQFEETKRKFLEKQKKELERDHPTYTAPKSKKKKDEEFDLDRGNSRVKGDGDKVTKQFKGTKKLQEKLVDEEFQRAKEFAKQFPGADVPVVKRDKDGLPYLEYPYLDKVRDMKPEERDRIYREIAEALKKAKKVMPDYKDNVYIDENGRPVIRDLTHLRDAPPTSDAYKAIETQSDDLDNRLRQLDEDIEKKSRSWINWNTKELEAEKEALEKEKEETQKKLREIEEAEKQKNDEETEKPGTWVFTAILHKTFPDVFNKYGVEFVKNTLVKDLYAINMLIITQMTEQGENNMFFKALSDGLGFQKNEHLQNKNKYTQLRNKYLGMYSKSRAELIANTPVISDEIRVGLMSVFYTIDLRFPNYFSEPIKEMITSYSNTNQSLRYTANSIKLLNSAKSSKNRYYKLLSRGSDNT